MKGLVLIRWRDARGCSGGWATVKEVLEDGSCEMISVGLLLRQDAEDHVVAPHYERGLKEDRYVSGVMHIPTSAVLEVVPLSPYRHRPSRQGARR